MLLFCVHDHHFDCEQNQSLLGGTRGALFPNMHIQVRMHLLYVCFARSTESRQLQTPTRVFYILGFKGIRQARRRAQREFTAIKFASFVKTKNFQRLLSHRRSNIKLIQLLTVRVVLCTTSCAISCLISIVDRVFKRCALDGGRHARHCDDASIVSARGWKRIDSQRLVLFC